MADEDELYISVNPETYRSGKANVLVCKSSSLTTLKKLNNLKILERQKNELKKELKKLFSSVRSDISEIQKLIPTTDVPKFVKKAISPIKKKSTVSKESKIIEENFKQQPKESSIDFELRMIQEKLRELNS
jgi:hypothetical protein